MTTEQKAKYLKPISRVMVLLASLCMGLVLVFPLWRIELDAPQYPEGLMLQIFPHKLGGDVEIINGLNHYIGMKSLHTGDFLEFTLLPYIIGAFALLSLVVFLLKRVRWLNIILFLLITFGIVAMADFWRWEYDYGHAINPHAAIQIPGMAYQPPLIGFKQLLNFGAFSVPDIGGWLFILSGVLLLTAVIIEWNKKSLKSSLKLSIVFWLASISMILMACESGPKPIRLGKDHCDFCKMTVADQKFAAELITKKGKVMFFDDLSCAIRYIRKGNVAEKDIEGIYVSDYLHPDVLHNVETAFFLKRNDLRSPMNGNIAAFISDEQRNQLNEDGTGKEMTWQELYNENNE